MDEGILEEVQMKKAEVTDIPHIARVHKESYSGDYTLPYFSIEIIGNYYLEFINKTDIIFEVCKKNDELLGFVLGGDGYALQNAKKAFKLHNRNAVIFECIKNLLNVPFMKKIFSACFSSIKAKSNRANVLIHKSVSDVNIRMLSITVDKNYKGKGIGSYLVNSFEHQLKGKGIRRYGLSVRRQNISAIKFYKTMGFKIYKETDTAFYYYRDIK